MVGCNNTVLTHRTGELWGCCCSCDHEGGADVAIALVAVEVDSPSRASLAFTWYRIEAESVELTRRVAIIIQVWQLSDPTAVLAVANNAGDEMSVLGKRDAGSITTGRQTILVAPDSEPIECGRAGTVTAIYPLVVRLQGDARPEVESLVLRLNPEVMSLIRRQIDLDIAISSKEVAIGGR